MALGCEEVRIAIIAGAPSAAALDHARVCAGCGFLARMSRLREAAPAAVDGPLAEAMADRTLVLGKYLLEARSGSGGQGVVYRATDVLAAESVALKAVRFAPDVAARIASEVRIARNVHHANVCRVHTCEQLGEIALIVMEHVDGGTLAERLTDDPPARAEAIAIFDAICGAIHAVHELGVLHLDLKPGNVLMRDRRSPAVADFGLAGPVGARAHGGTERYQSPEQLAGGRCDRTTDVYALGVLLGDLLGEDRGRWGRVVARATAADPADRFADVAALAAAMRRSTWRRPLGWAAAAVCTLVVVAALALALAPPPRGRRPAWRTDLWGEDRFATGVWNVAARLVATSHPGFACGSKPAELFDRRAQYDNPEHGFAFAPPPTARQPDAKCELFDGLDLCRGGYDDDARLCEITDPVHHDVRDDEAAFVVLPGRVRDRARFTAERRRQLGQLVTRLPCGERWLIVDLGRPRRIVGARAWFHGFTEVPRSWAVEVEAPAGVGGWQSIGGTNENEQGRPPSWYPGGAGGSMPVTLPTTPTRAKQVRIRFDTCSSLQPGVQTMAGVGWLYELEIFESVSRLEAWRRGLFGD